MLLTSLLPLYTSSSQYEQITHKLHTNISLAPQVMSVILIIKFAVVNLLCMFIMAHKLDIVIQYPHVQSTKCQPYNIEPCMVVEVEQLHTKC